MGSNLTESITLTASSQFPGQQLGFWQWRYINPNGNLLFSNLWILSRPQFLSLMLTVLVLVVISVIVYFKVRKVKPYEAPKGVALVAELYVTALDNNYDSTAGEGFPKAKYYIFALTTFLLVGNLAPVFGFDPIGTSYSIPLTFTLATWIGMFVSGFMYKRWRYLKEIAAPWDLINKIPPVISLGFRMYGNITGGGTVILLLYIVFGHIWMRVFGPQTEWFFFGNIVTPFLHFYFDVFDTTLQCYVFITLSMAYWLNEAGVEDGIDETKKESTWQRKIKEKIRLGKRAQAIY